jgi:hypothetical protein
MGWDERRLTSRVVKLQPASTTEKSEIGFLAVLSLNGNAGWLKP